MRTLALVLFGFVFAPLAMAESRIALIVANTDYDVDSWDLINPENDAVLISSALSEVGFEVHTVLNADRDEMEIAFQAHADRLNAAGRDATGFFYFAGHGVQSEGLNYLMPVDSEVYTEADVWAQAPRLENLFRHLRRANNQRNFVILDACRNNPLLSSRRSLSQGLASSREASGTLIAYATAPGSVALDGVGNSPYALVLADLIREPGYPVETMFRRVRTRVETMTEYRQRPWMESGLSGEIDFCFAGCEKSAMLANDEATALGQALQANSLSAFSEFLERFPGSKSRSLVQTRMDRLKETSVPTATQVPISIIPVEPDTNDSTGTVGSEIGVVTAATFQALAAPEPQATKVPGLILRRNDQVDVTWISKNRTWFKVKLGDKNGYIPAWAIQVVRTDPDPFD